MPIRGHNGLVLVAAMSARSRSIESASVEAGLAVSVCVAILQSAANYNAMGFRCLLQDIEQIVDIQYFI